MSDARDKFLNAPSAKDVSEIVPIDELGIKVEVRGMSVGDTETLTPEQMTGIGLLLRFVYDVESGELLFDPADADVLREKPSALTRPIIQAINRVNAFGEDEQAAIAADLGKEDRTDGTS